MDRLDAWGPAVTGRYIVIEGIDGAGKTRLVDELIGRLALLRCFAVGVREPSDTYLGDLLLDVQYRDDLDVSPLVRSYLYAADRLDLMEKVIRPSVDRGDWVISDRSYYSTLAYQVYGAGGDIAHIYRIVNPSLLVRPDLIILLDVSLATSQDRAMTPPDKAYRMDKVADGYRRLALTSDRWYSVDANYPFDQVAARVMATLIGRFPELNG